jgi:hypothetical protein
MFAHLASLKGGMKPSEYGVGVAPVADGNSRLAQLLSLLRLPRFPLV